MASTLKVSEPSVTYNELSLVEQPAIELLESLGWTHGNLMQELPGPQNSTGRLSWRETVLPARLRAALAKLNPWLLPEALELAELQLTQDRSAMLPVAANRELWRLMRDGVAVEVRQPDGSFKPERVPNAAFIGFTGTPLIAGQEQRTREVFGDHVSIYNFAQSVADGATVPLYYEARKPELQLADADVLRDDLDALLDAAMLDEEQEKKLQREFARQYHLITRPDRLDQIAADLARHFAARGYLGKAMFMAIDKATAVRMHDKFRAAWTVLLTEYEQRLAAAPPDVQASLQQRMAWMRAVDCAVVVPARRSES